MKELERLITIQVGNQAITGFGSSFDPEFLQCFPTFSTFARLLPQVWFSFTFSKSMIMV